MSRFLALAVAQLGQGDPHANRRAAWFARSALEDIIIELLEAKSIDIGAAASARARLSCLESLYREDDPAVATQAEYAWSRLSEACHQHAYELTPTHSEVEHLVTLVGGLGQRWVQISAIVDTPRARRPATATSAPGPFPRSPGSPSSAWAE